MVMKGATTLTVFGTLAELLFSNQNNIQSMIIPEDQKMKLYNGIKSMWHQCPPLLETRCVEVHALSRGGRQ